ncbi:MAG: transglutaminase domain-containing protein [Pirellulaceae bacterium]|jgi:hypothetical protein|nr:transglutaminase domain-containing protein [Pirellulaceae bacterium]
MKSLCILILGLVGVVVAQDSAVESKVSDETPQTSPLGSRVTSIADSDSKTGVFHPMHIEGAVDGIESPTLAGPRFYAPQLFQGFEDYYHPRLRRLREEYALEEVIANEPNEFRRILKLRHWVQNRWHIANDQRFSGDAFAILEKAKTGAGFHCGHSMKVLHAVLSSMGYVSRYVLVDRNHEDLGRSSHHGVDGVWSNDFTKWVLLDAKQVTGEGHWGHW